MFFHIVGIRDHYIHVGVGSDVVCSTVIGKPEPQFVERTATIPRLFYVRIEPAMSTYERADMNTLPNGSLPGEEADSPNAEVTLGIIPEAESSQKGVSVRYVPSPDKAWYVLRASYGRESRVYDLLLELGVYAYIVQRYEVKEVRGKRKKVLVSLIPNIVFAYIPKDKADLYVKAPSQPLLKAGKENSAGNKVLDDVLKNIIELSYLSSFYYNHFEKDEHDADKNPPLTIKEHEMIPFIQATSTKSKNLKSVDLDKCRLLFDNKMVEVTKGDYKGVIGRVARVAGQQCIIVSLANGKWNISTDYIPTPFIKVIDEAPFEGNYSGSSAGKPKQQ